MDDDAVGRVLDDLAQLPPLGAWVTEAACRGMPEVFTERPDKGELALVERVCRRCPVAAECEAFAAENVVHGVYAGTFHRLAGHYGAAA